MLSGCEGHEGTLLIRGHATSAGGTPASTSSAEPYSPVPGISWQAQLSGNIDVALPVELFYLDPDFAGEDTLAELRSRGRRIVCYVSATTFEPWRDDAANFPASTLGNPLASYPREQWIDIRDGTVRAIMQKRVEALAVYGCEGVDPASLATHTADSGFDITRADVLEYARWLSAEIHSRGMSTGLSAAEDIVGDLQGSFDWGLAIDCLQGSGCAPFVPLRSSGRAVLLVEFGDESTATDVCSAASNLGFDALVKGPAFDGFRIGCDDNP